MSARPAILLVEDDRDELDVVLRALEQAGFGAQGIEIARDGVEALAALGLGEGDGRGESERCGVRGVRSPPRVVFLDLKMPRVDGWEVLRNIRAHPRMSEVPVVVVSSSDRPEDIARSYALGANSFLLKRFDRARPGGYIAEAARYWLELNRTPQ